MRHGRSTEPLQLVNAAGGIGSIRHSHPTRGVPELATTCQATDINNDGNALIESECFVGCGKRSAGPPFLLPIGVSARCLSNPTGCPIESMCRRASTTSRAHVYMNRSRHQSLGKLVSCASATSIQCIEVRRRRLKPPLRFAAMQLPGL